MTDKKLQEFSNFLTSGQFCSRYNNNNFDGVQNLNILSYYSKILTLSIHRLILSPMRTMDEIKNVNNLVYDMIKYVGQKYVRKCIIGNLSSNIKSIIRENKNHSDLDVLITDFEKKLENPYLSLMLDTSYVYNSDLDILKKLFREARDEIRSTDFNVNSVLKDKDLVLLQRLQNTYRWNNTPLHTTFSILEHQFITCLLTYTKMLIDNPTESRIDVSITSVGGLLHDILEIETDDVIRPIKKLIPEVIETAEKVAKDKVIYEYLEINQTNPFLVSIGDEFSTIRSGRKKYLPLLKFVYSGKTVQLCDNVSAYSELTFNSRSLDFVSEIKRIIDGEKKVVGITGDRCELLYVFSRIKEKSIIKKIMEWLNDR